MTIKVAAMTAVVALAFASVSAAAQVTSGYGTRSDPFHGKASKHAGIDIASPTGTPIYATADAQVGRAQWAGGYGNLVELNHAGGYQTRYAHMHRIYVKPGQYVRRGTVVGLVGSTGRSTGPHLHYEVRFNGRPIDPTPFIRGGAQMAAQAAPVRRVRRDYGIAAGRVAMGGPED